MKLIISGLLLLCSIHVSAQFVGEYSLNDGGVDVMSSSLMILPNNEFAIGTMGGVIIGSWKQISKDKIELKEVKLNDQVFSIYGAVTNKPGKETEFEFLNFDHKEVQAFLAKDGLEKPVYQPVIGEIFQSDYTISRPAGKYEQIKLAYHLDPEFQRSAYVYPYKAVSLTYILPAKYTKYKIVFDESATHPGSKFQMELKGNEYFINGKNIGEKKPITEKSQAQLRQYKEVMNKTMETGESQHNYRVAIKNEKIKPVRIDTIELNKSILPPLIGKKTAE